ncbi:kelch-like protein 20 [Acipenser oxyrinchus oxyrinchus]|uniref:Kelch-like protein 20 n=1 Tax=Acipenser oxyrinchus oxyrinchus TaxID=40147 RepID=A0AAD8CI95_ACIOX|nr:kelch-like protein 20 [Acipenser oxyrinchus oxyrinchus]
MGVYNEKGEAIDESKNCVMLPPEKPDTPLTRSRACKTVRYGEVVFAVGGWSINDPASRMECYNPQVHEWRVRAPMAKHRSDVAVAVLGDMIYAVGGHDEISCTSSVERCDPKSNTWSNNVASLSSGQWRGVGCYGRYLYSIGGYDGITCMNMVERYDPQVNMWFKVAPMSSRRKGAAVAVLDGYLYAIGGSDEDSALNTVERYNPAEDCWSHSPCMGSWRENPGCCVFQGMIYIAGGVMKCSSSALPALDPQNNSWSPVRPMRCKRNQVGLAVVDGILLAVGGFDGTTYLKSVEAYSLDTNTWRHYGSMKCKHPGGGVCVVKMEQCDSLIS